MRLCDATLGQARAGVLLPGYERAGLPVGIVHLGLGAFVRAHMATYTDDRCWRRAGALGHCRGRV